MLLRGGWQQVLEQTHGSCGTLCCSPRSLFVETRWAISFSLVSLKPFRLKMCFALCVAVRQPATMSLLFAVGISSWLAAGHPCPCCLLPLPAPPPALGAALVQPAPSSACSHTPNGTPKACFHLCVDQTDGNLNRKELLVFVEWIISIYSASGKLCLFKGSASNWLWCFN